MSLSHLIEYPDPEQRTVSKLVQSAMSKFSDRIFLGEPGALHDKPAGSPYQFETYAQISAKLWGLARGLDALGVKRGARIGIWSINRIDWCVTDLAAAVAGFVSVPLYDTLGTGAVEFVTGHAELEVLVGSRDKLSQMIELRSKFPHVRYVVMMDGRPSDKRFLAEQRAAGKATDVLALSELIAKGAGLTTKFEEASPDDLYTIMYTSGTTGDPKGVMLTNRNVMSSAAALLLRVSKEYDHEQHYLLSYMPLAHIYERVLELINLTRGQAIGYFTGDIKKLPEDIALLRPTVLPGVPRVFQRVYDAIYQQVNASNVIRRTLFSWAVEDKQEAEKVRGTTPIWDKLVFSKVRERLGGRIKFMSSGSAPMSPLTAEFMRGVFGTAFVEGYGLTETAASGTAMEVDADGRYYGDYGHIGKPLQCNEFKLMDVPDMDYLTTDKPCPRGEICVRGHNVFIGYYKEPGKTAEVMEDGWFRTGDIGLLRADGNYQIIDRKKNIFKLSQGEYIRAEHIEREYGRSEWVLNNNVFVYGDSYKNHLVGVIVPNIEYARVSGKLKEWGLESASPAQICQDQRVREAVMESLTKAANDAKLQGFERMARVHLHPDEWTPENGMLTPSFKLKRHFMTQFFKPQLDALYATAKL
eukprot:TRINITY_DN393_c0_g1_i1.p1 TRINITY_DN393_c0_g1~~TRINITY_DN393_c0_g1_i1.p1  ORF type:complete len:640 (-),score=161.25 TRINITY_DN393_c0_g1_i1:53-1972(-)